MSIALLFSLLTGICNAGNDFVFRNSSRWNKRGILSFYFVASLSSTIMSILISAILSFTGKILEPVNIVFGLIAGTLSFFIYLLYILSFTGNSAPVPVTIFRLNLIPGVVLSILFLGEHLSLSRCIAIPLSIASIMLLTGMKPGIKLADTDAKPLLYSLIACILGGALNMVNKAAVINGADTFNLAFWRFLFVTLCTACYMAMHKNVNLERFTLLPGVFSGALLLAALGATLAALQFGDVIFVIPIAQILSIVMVSAVSWVFLKEGISNWRLAGIILAIISVVILNLNIKA
jgi:drug/metabolite transporter (DMT)-like permease